MSIGLLNVFRVKATIPSGQSVSSVVDLEDCEVLGLFVPALNNTPSITFQVADDEDSTPVDLLNKDGSTASITISGGASGFAVSSEDLKPLLGYRFVRVKSSAAQTADRHFYFIVKRPG